MELTQHTFLNQQLIFFQPKYGYRVAIDPVFLAAMVHPKSGDKILDVGTGVGGVILCLAHRLRQQMIPNIKFLGIEKDLELTKLATRNFVNNQLHTCAEAQVGDAMNKDIFPTDEFDHILTNPPYVAEGQGTVSGVSIKARANHESSITLTEWIESCHFWLKRGGQFYMIHRADRLAEILEIMNGFFTDIQVIPLWPKVGVPAKRILLQGRKRRRASHNPSPTRNPLTLHPGYVLHEEDGSYTFWAKEVLSGKKGINCLS